MVSSVEVVKHEFNEEIGSITVSGGIGSYTTIKSFNNVLGALYIVPISSNNTYRYNVQNSRGTTILNILGTQTGTSTLKQPLPLLGKITVNITGASIDEKFRIEIVYL